MGRSQRWLALIVVSARYSTALLGGIPSSHHVEPKLLFALDDADEHERASEAENWKPLAKKAASLEQLDCTAPLLEATVSMVDAAEAGDSLAMAALGTMYLLGQQCAPKRNLTWAMHWLSRAEHLGQPDAQAMMAFLHMSDVLRELYNYTGLVSNRTHARALYDRAARGGSTFARMAMAFRHGYGIGMLESCAESAALYEQAAQAAVDGLEEQRWHTVEQSNPVESDHLTLLSHSMSPRELDPSSIEYIDYMANIGDVQGKISMGHLYHYGSHGVPRDRTAAMEWFRSAARQGDGMGHSNLGIMQMRSRQYNSAMRSLRRGTKHKDPSAWAGLGYAHLFGAGVPRSDAKGAKCIWLAARQGHLDSIYNLGVLTMQGRGVPQSVKLGFRFLSVAAEFSHPQAQLTVGRMVRSGAGGVRKDCATSQFFLKHAAEAGPMVKSLMGTALHAYERTRPQRALIHYLLAAHAGVEAAQHNAGHLYMHEMPRLRPEEASLYAQRAHQYLKLAALQGSIDAQVQLANLLVNLGEHKGAVALLKEAGRAGSRDALFHLGLLYWHGQGVERSAKTALALWQSSDFSSKHAKLHGFQGMFFGVARFIVEFRAFLLFAGGLCAIMSTGGNPLEILRGAMGGGNANAASSQADWEEEDEEDLFADED